MTSLLCVLGSVTPPGRMSRALDALAQAARDAVPGTDASVLNLADYRISFADGRPLDQLGDDTARAVQQIQEADAVVIASPVYRGSYTGALKNLLDQTPIEALMGKACGIVAMGATPHHYLGVDWHLRDILTWYGAMVAPTSVYLASGDFTDGVLNPGAHDQLAALAATVLRLQAALASAGTLGPTPLAARRG